MYWSTPIFGFLWLSNWNEWGVCVEGGGSWRGFKRRLDRAKRGKCGADRPGLWNQVPVDIRGAFPCCNSGGLLEGVGGLVEVG